MHPSNKGRRENASATREEAAVKVNQKTTAARVSGGGGITQVSLSLSHLLCARGDAAASRDAAPGGRNSPDAGSASDGSGGAQGAALHGCHCR